MMAGSWQQSVYTVSEGEYEVLQRALRRELCAAVSCVTLPNSEYSILSRLQGQYDLFDRLAAEILEEANVVVTA